MTSSADLHPTSRADTARTSEAILRAAEQVLREDSGATMEQIAKQAGVARTTVHRRFDNRDALIAAMTLWAARRFESAVFDEYSPATPPLIALYQMTARVLRVKIGWNYAMQLSATSTDPDVARIHAEVSRACRELLLRAVDTGVLREDVDVDWAQRVYYGLIHSASETPDADPQAMATLVVDTLLSGLGTGTLR